jgi:hypothetical protein
MRSSRIPLFLVMIFIALAHSMKSGQAQKTVAPEKENLTAYFSPSKVDNLKKNSLFVFVGEKIELKSLPQKEPAFDSAFIARYKILDKVYGDYSKDVIEFEVYDHHGEPAFSKYQNVLLFVSVYQGKFYHEKYQFFDLYKTTDGKWASPYAVGDYKHSYNKNTSIKPKKIEFAESVEFDVSTWKSKVIREWRPTPYFVVANGKAKAVYGNYIPELFKLKRNGVLKARELF